MTYKISKRIYEERMESGLLQSEVADKIFISRRSYGMYEKGQRTPSIEIIAKIAEAFGVTPQYLAGWTDDRKDYGK